MLCSIASAAAVWLCVAADQVARGLLGSMLGVPFRGLEISAAGRYLPVAQQGATTSLGPGGFALMVLGGAAMMVGLAFALYALVRTIHAAGWLRGLALAWITVALLWLPAALAIAVVPAGRGPVRELYARLGEPMAGRWTALALGVFVLVLSAGVVSRCAVAIGRAWMRADGLEFRRRLVRVTAGWPSVTALLAMSYVVGWAPAPWALLLPVAVLVALQFQTR